MSNIRTRINSCLILLILLSSFPAVSGQDETLGVEDISFDIEGGNGTNLKQIGKNRFQFDVEYDTGSTYYCYWFKFEILRDAQGQTVSFQAKLPSNPFFSYDWLKPVYSYDGVNWNYIENREYDSGSLKFTQRFTEDQVTVAVGFPYTLNELESFIASIEDLPYVETQVLGYSDENRPIHLVKITDPSIDESMKKHIFVASGQHPGETHGMLIIQGLMNYLLINPDMRSKYVYHIMPLVNVDGVNAGNTRFDTNSVDLNREWDDADMEPEIQCLYQYLASNQFDLVIDSHSQESGYPYFGVTTGAETYQDTIDLWRCVEPYTYYDRTLDSAPIIGSLRWEAYDDFGFLAVVIEHSQTNYAWSYIEYINEGMGLVKGINDYFNTPEPILHDIAVTSMTAPSSVITGETVPIMTIIENQGSYSETFEVVCIDETESTIIDTRSLTLQPGESKVINLQWDTITASLGLHTITSTAGPVEDEADTQDNINACIINLESPTTDIAITEVNMLSSAYLGDKVSITVTAINQGNQPITGDISFTLRDETSNTLIASLVATGGLSPSETASLSYIWDTSESSPGLHTVSAAHDLIDDDPENDQMTSIITLTEGSTTMHVADIDAVKTLKGKSGRCEVFITLTIMDNLNNPVNGAIITGDFTGDITSTINIVTGIDGKSVFSTGNLSGLNGITFTVTDIIHNQLIYTPNDNSDPDTDSDGTTITVN